jgi:very-short-patch-repair endonuclease
MVRRTDGLDPKSTARGLRKKQTRAESALWELLRGRKVLGLKFRRQAPIGRYIADFCCRELRLVVEVDGGVHADETRIRHDIQRDDYLRSLNHHVLRFPNEEVLDNPGAVLEDTRRDALRLCPSLRHRNKHPSPPLPGRAGGVAGEMR